MSVFPVYLDIFFNLIINKIYKFYLLFSFKLKRILKIQRTPETNIHTIVIMSSKKGVAGALVVAGTLDDECKGVISSITLNRWLENNGIDRAITRGKDLHGDFANGVLIIYPEKKMYDMLDINNLETILKQLFKSKNELRAFILEVRSIQTKYKHTIHQEAVSRAAESNSELHKFYTQIFGHDKYLSDSVCFRDYRSFTIRLDLNDPQVDEHLKKFIKTIDKFLECNRLTHGVFEMESYYRYIDIPYSITTDSQLYPFNLDDISLEMATLINSILT